MSSLAAFWLIALLSMGCASEGGRKALIKTLVGNSCVKLQYQDNGTTYSEPVGHLQNAFPLLNCTDFDPATFAPSEKQESLLDIKELLIRDSELSEFNLDHLTLLPNLEKLHFQRNALLKAITSREGNKFKLITSLFISSSPYVVLSRGLSTALPSLQEFVLYDCASNTTNPTLDLVDFRSLEILNLTNSALSTSNLTWFTNSMSLKTLVLSNTGLRQFAFGPNQCKALQVLDLSHNQLTRLPAGFLACNLSTLDISSNMISAIDGNAWSGAPNLKYLNLANNSITSPPVSFFAWLSAEVVVDLTRNPFNCDCQLPWLKSLVNENANSDNPEVRLTCETPARLNGLTLPTANHSFQSICLEDEDGKQRVKNLTDSHCSSYYNRKQYLANHFQMHKVMLDDVFYPMWFCDGFPLLDIPVTIDSNTRGLFMTRGQLTTVNITQLAATTPNIVSLSLPNNKIERLLSSPSTQLPSLTVLSLEGNKLTTISKEFLRSFPKLRKIRLHNNNFVAFDNNLFQHNRRVTKLLLGPNPNIRHFSGRCLDGLNVVKAVLRGLHLRHVPGVFKNNTNMKIIDLGENLITHISPNDFSMDNVITDLALDGNSLNFIENQTFANFFNLDNLDLSENELTNLSPDAMPEIPQPSLRVNLWHNPFKCDCSMRPFFEWANQLEQNFPSSRVRFQCQGPPRMAGNLSDKTASTDYVCFQSQTFRTSKHVHQETHPYTIGEMLLAVILTFLLTVILIGVVHRCVIVRFRNRNFAKRFKAYEFIQDSVL